MKIKFWAKSLVLLLLLCVAATLFSACGSGDDSTQPPSIETPDQSTGENGDTSGKPTVDPTCEHVSVTDPAVEPTCEEKGKTEGAHCEKCGEVLKAQEEVPAKGHDWENRKCKVCDAVDASEGLKYVLDGNSYIVTGIGTCEDVDIIIPNTYKDKPVTAIADNAFKDCTYLKSVTMFDNVKSIGNKAFSGCTGMTSIITGNGVKTIGKYAFSDCTALRNIFLSDNITNIGDSAFVNSSKLKTVNISDIAAWFKIRFDSAYSNPLCYGASLYLNQELLSNLTVPENVTSIKNYLFSGCKSLLSITIPNSVTSIGDYAFSHCSGLTSITIPNSVTSIGESAFYDCTGLTSITIPDNVTNIGSSVFRGCTNLTALTLPNMLNTMGYLFGVDQSFSYDRPTEIPKKLETIVITGGTEICYRAFFHCKNIKSITVPDSVTFIGKEAFARCTGLENIVLSKNITSFEFEIFFMCQSLKNIEIPSSVTSIGDKVFDCCYSLASIVIPNNVKSIGKSAFSGCSKLTNIYCEAKSMPADWDANWKGNCSATVHWGNEWEYVDGVPTLK